MGRVTTRNVYSSLKKYNKMYIVASCWTIIDIEQHDFSAALSPVMLALFIFMKLVSYGQNSAPGLE